MKKKKAITVVERKPAFARSKSRHEEVQLRPRLLRSRVVERAADLLTSCHVEVALQSPDAFHLAMALIHARGPLCDTNNPLRAWPNAWVWPVSLKTFLK